ncbi:unnamed protein product [Paramecium sonneborni]|uniref:Uncharacterized protein n=1 Tax=Paramecium sonneborni TaxID=65129 RepID=A0A8S1RME7_9CILI|nr:unnamed protein product [Paramecium sonneborni]
MLNQFTTPSKIPQPSPLPYNQEQYLNVLLHERLIQQQQNYGTPQIITPPSQQTTSTQINSPNSNQLKHQKYSVIQQINSHDMQNQYSQIMQYYKELDINMQQQKQENYLKYNQIIQKIDNIQQIMVQNINQLNLNQYNEYQQLIQQLQQQRLDNQKRYEELFQNLESHQVQNNYDNQFQSRELLQHQIIKQQNQPITNNINQVTSQQHTYQTYASKPISFEQKLFPQKQQHHSQDQINYTQIHSRSNKQSSPQIQISINNLSQDNNTFAINQLTPFFQYSPLKQNHSQNEKQLNHSPSNKQLIHNQVQNNIIKEIKSTREQISPSVYGNSPKNIIRDNSNQHQKKQIFEKPVFKQINKKPFFLQNPQIKNFDHQIPQQQNYIQQQQQQYYQVQQSSDESIIIDEQKNSLLQQLKTEYETNSSTSNTSYQLIAQQLQLIYCVYCDQYISHLLSDQHLQVCNSQRPQRRQNESYLDKYIIYRGNDLLIETLEAKNKSICQEILNIKLMMQLAQLQKFAIQEQIQLKEFCQIAILILDRLLQNPNSSQVIQYYQQIQQIFKVIYVAPQIFFKQQAKLLQKCLDRIKELYQLFKK